MIMNQWIIQYDGSIWKEHYLQLDPINGVVGVGDITRATVFNESMKEKYKSYIFDTCMRKGFLKPRWKTVQVYLNIQ